MSHPLDGNGYPTDDTLHRIEQWEVSDCDGLMEFLQKAWHYGEPYAPARHSVHCETMDEEVEQWEVSTGGWSGNEEMIGAMQKNTLWWLFHWWESRRGGHFKFRAMRTQEASDAEE